MPPQARIPVPHVSIPATLSEHFSLPLLANPSHVRLPRVFILHPPSFGYLADEVQDICLLIASNKHFSIYHPQFSIHWSLAISYTSGRSEIWFLPFSKIHLSLLTKYQPCPQHPAPCSYTCSFSLR